MPQIGLSKTPSENLSITQPSRNQVTILTQMIDVAIVKTIHELDSNLQIVGNKIMERLIKVV